MNDDIYERRQNAIEELDEEFYNDPDQDLDDMIFELADQAVPVYTSDILQAAADHSDFALLEPDIGPAFDGSPTPVNIIAANIYEFFTNELYEEYYRLQEEYKEAKNDAFDALHEQGELPKEAACLVVGVGGPWTLVAYVDEEGDEVIYLQAGPEYEHIEL